MAAGWQKGWNGAALTAESAEPGATGAPLLYAMRFCPFSHRAVLVVAAKGIQFWSPSPSCSQGSQGMGPRVDIKPISLASKPSWYAMLNPNGSVPTFQQGAGVVYDSLILAEYLDEVIYSYFRPMQSGISLTDLRRALLAPQRPTGEGPRKDPRGIPHEGQIHDALAVVPI